MGGGAMPDAKGFWVGSQLFWRIDGVSDPVSDADLRRFIFHNNESYSRYVGSCVLACHIKQYAEAHK